MPVITLLPLSVTVVGAVFAIVLLNRYFGGRRRPHELVWGISFSLFAIAAACQVYSDIAGSWSVFSAQVYYLLGGILVVGLLGVGREGRENSQDPRADAQQRSEVKMVRRRAKGTANVRGRGFTGSSFFRNLCCSVLCACNHSRLAVGPCSEGDEGRGVGLP